MTTEKIVSVNYTAEQTAQAVASYTQGATVEAIAEALGKSVRSVVAKLSREKVYVAKVAPKGARVTKAHLVAGIAEATGASPAALESLEKATHEALEIVFAFVKPA